MSTSTDAARQRQSTVASSEPSGGAEPRSYESSTGSASRQPAVAVKRATSTTRDLSKAAKSDCDIVIKQSSGSAVYRAVLKELYLAPRAAGSSAAGGSAARHFAVVTWNVSAWRDAVLAVGKSANIDGDTAWHIIECYKHQGSCAVGRETVTATSNGTRAVYVCIHLLDTPLLMRHPDCPGFEAIIIDEPSRHQAVRRFVMDIDGDLSDLDLTHERPVVNMKHFLEAIGGNHWGQPSKRAMGLLYEMLTSDNEDKDSYDISVAARYLRNTLLTSYVVAEVAEARRKAESYRACLVGLAHLLRCAICAQPADEDESSIELSRELHAAQDDCMSTILVLDELLRLAKEKYDALERNGFDSDVLTDVARRVVILGEWEDGLQLARAKACVLMADEPIDPIDPTRHKKKLSSEEVSPLTALFDKRRRVDYDAAGDEGAMRNSLEMALRREEARLRTQA
jgi:hypothetical protein